MQGPHLAAINNLVLGLDAETTRKFGRTTPWGLNSDWWI